MAKRDREKLGERVALFLHQYGTGRRPGHLNDRDYDREVEELVKRMTPAELAELLRDEEEATPNEPADRAV